MMTPIGIFGNSHQPIVKNTIHAGNIGSSLKLSRM